MLYLAALGLCFIFYIAYGQWLSWLILLTVLLLPWFSLVVSLPAIFRFQAFPGGPAVLEQGMDGELWLVGSCPFPMPLFRGKLKMKHLITGKTWYYQDREDLPADHCGGIAVTAESVRVCDYLGLFSFPSSSREQKVILIRPRPLKMEIHSAVQQTARSWKPKSGGGYAENHELRLYRPGDSLNQVHWKLSAKTGTLILREAMEPQRGQILLTMNLRGSAEEMDRAFGRLLWLGRYLLEQNLYYDLQAMTAQGVLSFSITTESDLQRTIDILLCQKAAPSGDLRDRKFSAAWHCHIGGEPDEA